MVNNYLLLIFLIPIPTLVADSVFAQQAPVADKIREESIHHGHTRIDDYNWMRESENPKVLAYLQAENEYLKFLRIFWPWMK